MKKYFIYTIIFMTMSIISCNNKFEKKLNKTETDITTKQTDLNKLQPYLLDTYKDGKEKKMKYFEIVNGKKIFKYYKEFYPDGSTKVEGPLKNDKREGHWVYFYENGVKWSEGNYINGKAVGKFTIRYNDGLLWEEIYYKQGVKSKEIVYDKNGKVIDEREYKP